MFCTFRYESFKSKKNNMVILVFLELGISRKKNCDEIMNYLTKLLPLIVQFGVLL